MNKTILVCDKKNGFFRFINAKFKDDFTFIKVKNLEKFKENKIRSYYGIIIFYYDDEDIFEIVKIINIKENNILVCAFKDTVLDKIKEFNKILTLNISKQNEDLKNYFELILKHEFYTL